MVNVAVCVATCLRPLGLEKLLESLAGLCLAKSPGLNITVIVVDNDQAGSARQVVERYISRLPLVIYEIEPVRNISLARNRAVAIAGKLNCPYIAFVDDDEFVEPAWLDEMFNTMFKYSADIVIGPVAPFFAHPVPRWQLKGRFFERPAYKTGEQLRWGKTGNVLFKCECLDLLEGPFDARFGLTGGEDTHLFERLYYTGVYMVWCNEAMVWETMPPSRTNLAWILRRAHFNGNTLALAEKALGASGKKLFTRLLKGAGRLFQGILILLPSLLLGRASAARSLVYMARGVGMITGVCGCKLEEYKKIHGT